MTNSSSPACQQADKDLCSTESSSTIDQTLKLFAAMWPCLKKVLVVVSYWNRTTPRLQLWQHWNKPWRVLEQKQEKETKTLVPAVQSMSSRALLVCKKTSGRLEMEGQLGRVVAQDLRTLNYCHGGCRPASRWEKTKQNRCGGLVCQGKKVSWIPTPTSNEIGTHALQPIASTQPCEM